MTLDWHAFTPWPALAGGALIGFAVAGLLLLGGRVAGISGILGGLLRSGDRGWRLAFLGGLLAAPWVFALVQDMVPPRIDADGVTLIAAGLLVGIGARYGAGCTSGHGVCGLSRRSPRSAVATAVFMAAGFATVYVVQHLI